MSMINMAIFKSPPLYIRASFVTSCIAMLFGYVPFATPIQLDFFADLLVQA